MGLAGVTRDGSTGTTAYPQPTHSLLTACQRRVDRSGAPQGGHKTDRPRGTECCSGERALGPQPLIILKTNGNFANPVRAGFDQFLVQPHLEFCRAYKAKTHLKDRDSPQVVLRVYFALTKDLSLSLPLCLSVTLRAERTAHCREGVSQSSSLSLTQGYACYTERSQACAEA